MGYVQPHDRGFTFKVFVQPRSSKNEMTGFHGGAVKIKLKAPPVEGAANKMCISFLAKSLDVPKSSLEILSGQTGRTKQILLHHPASRSRQTEREAARRELESLIESLMPAKKTT